MYIEFVVMKRTICDSTTVRCDLPRFTSFPRLASSFSFISFFLPNQGATRTLAKQLVQLRGQKDQLYSARARIAGVGNAAASAATTGI